MADKLFADGLIVKKRKNAPDYVICSLSVKCRDFFEFMKKHQKDGWLNLDVKESKNHKFYAEVDTWEPQEPAPQSQPGEQDIPF